MMERSSKFLSLSGLSGISAGVIAIIGAALAYFHILREPANADFNTTHEAMFREITLLITDAAAVLLFSICFGIYFSWRKSVKNNLMPSKSLIKRTLYSLGVKNTLQPWCPPCYRRDLCSYFPVARRPGDGNHHDTCFLWSCLDQCIQIYSRRSPLPGFDRSSFGYHRRFVSRPEPPALDNRIRSLPYHLRNGYVHQI